ncbi:Tad domain-containing protein [Alkalibacillus haloalkaliphilus]|uniref:Tad domain-containing protein n=1 Tax=Alkalibacillus haloalkaliphilus TaxID=94136 RepID=UPI002935352D|nr:Tad domain-containing protein [Alkalibacillus haloalkaliphilus]MDV2581448.1 Tad domain-containing protein [Alkalibacillus haloalkaliphilus]
MKNYLNERGNIAIFVLGMLSIIMVMFILVINMASALATKEQSSTTVQQASLAATSVFYEEVSRVIDEYEDETLEGSLLAFFEDFNEKVSDRVDQLSSSEGYTGWSQNEINIEAFNQVLTEELNEPIVRTTLRGLLQDEEVRTSVINEARNTIQRNNGVLDGAVLTVSDNRFYVRAANEFESTSLDGIVGQINEHVYQESAGPTINFLELIWPSSSSTIPLDH